MLLVTFTEETEYHHSIAVSQYWDESLHMFQHSFYEVHKKMDLNHLASDVKAFKQAINVPLYQEDLSGAVNIDISESSHEHSEPIDHSNYRSSSPHDGQYNEDDTCTKELCDNTEQRKKTYSEMKTQLKILSFNIWNTNVVQGGYKEYKSRIKQIAKVCSIHVVEQR